MTAAGFILIGLAAGSLSILAWWLYEPGAVVTVILWLLPYKPMGK